MFLPNIDTLVYTALPHNYNKSIEKLLDLLEANQDSAKLKRSNEIVTLGSETFELLPNGARNYKYILHNSKYEIKLQQIYNDKASNFPIYVKLKSEFLWNLRNQAYYESIRFLEELFHKIVDVKISRCDLCCHTDKVKMNSLKLSKFVTRSTSKELHVETADNDASAELINKAQIFMTGQNLTGLSFGKSPIRLRIYDKNLEIIQSSKKTWFQDIWSEHGITETDIVVNVEFQLNREFMKIHKIDTYEELNNEIKSIWIYLTTKWIRYVKLDNKHKSRCTTEKFWDDLSHAYDNDWRSINGIQRYKQVGASRDHLLNMLKCYMVNDAAHLGITDFTEYAREMLADVFFLLDEKNQDFTLEVNKKRSLIGG